VGAGQKVLSWPSADSFAVGRRQKQATQIISVCQTGPPLLPILKPKINISYSTVISLPTNRQVIVAEYVGRHRSRAVSQSHTKKAHI
jgi:hypothetical protein